MTVFGELPAIGLGCSPYREGQRVDLGGAIQRALEAGYPLLDTAEAYGNETQVGEALRRHRRSHLSLPLVVSKVWQTNHAYENVLQACEESLERLGVETLDLYLIHSPEAWRHTGRLGDLSRQPLATAEARTTPCTTAGLRALERVPLAETWSAMEELHRRGHVRGVGVSNFSRSDLEALLATSTLTPAVNQIERHPYRPRSDLIDFCRRHGIQVMAHSPLSSPGLLSEPMLTKIARRHGRSPAQVVLRWNMEGGVTPIPGSRDERHVLENLQALDFGLEAAEVAEIDSLEKERSQLLRPSELPRGSGSVSES